MAHRLILAAVHIGETHVRGLVAGRAKRDQPVQSLDPRHCCLDVGPALMTLDRPLGPLVTADLATPLGSPRRPLLAEFPLFRRQLRPQVGPPTRGRHQFNDERRLLAPPGERSLLPSGETQFLRTAKEFDRRVLYDDARHRGQSDGLSPLAELLAVSRVETRPCHALPGLSNLCRRLRHVMRLSSELVASCFDPALAPVVSFPPYERAAESYWGHGHARQLQSPSQSVSA